LGQVTFLRRRRAGHGFSFSRVADKGLTRFSNKSVKIIGIACGIVSKILIITIAQKLIRMQTKNIE
jgi:hypothetical protein